MKFYITIYAVFFVIFNFNAQEAEYASVKKIDSLLRQANKDFRSYQLKKSIETASQIIEISDPRDHRYQIIRAYEIKGKNYQLIKDYKAAENTYREAIGLASTKFDTRLLASLYNNLGIVYYKGYGDFEKALSYYEESLTWANRSLNDFEKINPLLNISRLLLNEDNYDKAYTYLLKVKRLIAEEGTADSKAQINHLMGQYYFSEGVYDKAKESFEQGIEIAKSKRNYSVLADIYLTYAKILAKLDEKDMAYEASMNYIKYSERVLNQERVTQSEISKARFNLDEYKRDLVVAKRERELQKKASEKTQLLNAITLVITGILFVLLILLFKSYNSKKGFSRILEEKNLELELAKNEAEKLSRLKTQFISTVSHELRTPLYGVVGLTSLLLERNNLSQRDSKFLRSLKFSGDYLLNLINDILQISKIDSNKVKLQNVSFNIRTLLEDMSKSFQYQLEEKQNELHLMIDENLPDMLIGDTVHLSQIMVNLVGNACKFTENGDVWILLKVINRKDNKVRVRFEVEDNGIGIPKEEQSLVFDNFSQIRSEKNNYMGTGLGLSIVKNLLNIMGSDISLESELGKGTKFVFELELELDKPTFKIEIQEPDLLEKAKDEGFKILIVEDNKINQMVTQNILMNGKFQYGNAENGREAIQKVKRDHYDLILMDLNMPIMGGIEATQKIRRFNKQIPIVALTASEIDTKKQDILDVGIDDIIIKPYDTHEFYQVILKNIYKKAKQKKVLIPAND
ncbi:ATP-binding protein [Ascidiimonas sp. W6]|uniref:ATP-binding protein n=1 Tax=Ascidiimonas meishanensis TaxID=3128903 RepID=UPI0030EBB51B